MTMLSMQISKKRIKVCKQIILVLVLGLLCLTGCANEPEQQISLVIEDTEEEITQARWFAGHRVEGDTPLVLYVETGNGFASIGTVAEGTWLQLEEKQPVSRWIKVEQTDWYVDATQLTLSEYKQEIVNHLVPFNENVITIESWDLLDHRGQVLMHFDQACEYPIYVKDQQQIGILFQNRILYINHDQISEIKEHQNSHEVLAKQVPVMMYHFFYDQSKGEIRKDSNFVEVTEFQQQMDALKENDFISLTMMELDLFLDGKANVPAKSFVITIDDGDPSVYEYAYPVLRQSGYNATLFLITGWLEPELPWSFIEMREAGLELQSHSFLMHQGGCKGMGHGGRLLCIDEEEGIADTKRSLEYVDGGFAYCYPFGDINDKAVSILQKAGVRLAFTTEYGKVESGMNKYRLPRIRVSGGVSIEQYINALN